MISENKNQNVEVSTVEKKKRNYKKKEAVEAPIKPPVETKIEPPIEAKTAVAKAKPNRSKKQPIETPQNDGGTEMDPSIAEGNFSYTVVCSLCLCDEFVITTKSV